MALTADVQIDLSDQSIKSRYIISSQHRRTGNPNKSIWIVDFATELECFVNAITNEWTSDYKGWGLLRFADDITVLGLNNDEIELKVAKFVDANTNDIWHGYPADCMGRPQDIPVVSILQKWVEENYITKAKMNKLRRGISCNL